MDEPCLSMETDISRSKESILWKNKQIKDDKTVCLTDNKN